MLAQVLSVAVLFVGATGTIATREAGDVSEKKPAAALGVLARPSLHDYSTEADAALRAEALARSTAERVLPVRTLCRLHDALRRDRRTETNEAYQELENKLFLRLRKVQADLQRQLAKARPANGRGSAIAAASAVTGPRDSGGAGLLIEAAQAAAPARGGGLVEDEGQTLVDLIQRTIATDSWDVNGGKSTIVYYAPLHVLVVSAPDEVQGDVGGILQGLRAAGP